MGVGGWSMGQDRTGSKVQTSMCNRDLLGCAFLKLQKEAYETRTKVDLGRCGN